jgi:hypothetical protein
LFFCFHLYKNTVNMTDSNNTNHDFKYKLFSKHATNYMCTHTYLGIFQ